MSSCSSSCLLLSTCSRSCLSLCLPVGVSTCSVFALITIPRAQNTSLHLYPSTALFDKGCLGRNVTSCLLCHMNKTNLQHLHK
uniref:Secreted protein n=1 Tax=Engystomops pustulosus TaxID=76066 RepID=A0AAV6YMM7_ENGPU|nr:hypothetical protein GDO81_029064 [Engystomops pustulosus]